MSKKTIIYDRTSPASLVAKNKAKRKNPYARVVESSNKEILKEALEGNVKNIINCDPNLDKRHLKGDSVVDENVAVKKAETDKKKADAKKVADKKKADAKKVADKKKADAKKAKSKKAAKAKKPATKKKK
jgi:hypothetical protein